MKFVDSKFEQALAQKNQTVDKELEELKEKRTEMQSIIRKKNQGREYLTLGRNGLIPCGIKTEEKMEEYEQTVTKQDEAERFALEFNSLTKKKRKELTIPDIREKLNGGMDLPFADNGIHISVVSNLTLQTIPEILETLDVVVGDNKIVENENIKIVYEPVMDYQKYIIEDIDITIFVTNTGMYKLSFKW